MCFLQISNLKLLTLASVSFVSRRRGVIRQFKHVQVRPGGVAIGRHLLVKTSQRTKQQWIR